MVSDNKISTEKLGLTWNDMNDFQNYRSRGGVSEELKFTLEIFHSTTSLFNERDILSKFRQIGSVVLEHMTLEIAEDGRP